MSLYNALFGQNPAAPLYLEMLGLTRESTGRFRDAYLHEDPAGGLKIVIFTRNGGGNREDQSEAIQRLQGHPNYVRDFDDDFDATYASFMFTIPDKFKDVVAELVKKDPKTDPMAKFRNLIRKLEAKQTDDPEVARATQVGEEIFAKIAAGDTKIEV